MRFSQAQAARRRTVHGSFSLTARVARPQRNRRKDCQGEVSGARRGRASAGRCERFAILKARVDALKGAGGCARIGLAIIDAARR